MLSAQLVSLQTVRAKVFGASDNWVVFARVLHGRILVRWNVPDDTAQDVLAIEDHLTLIFGSKGPIESFIHPLL